MKQNKLQWREFFVKNCDKNRWKVSQKHTYTGTHTHLYSASREQKKTPARHSKSLMSERYFSGWWSGWRSGREKIMKNNNNGVKYKNKSEKFSVFYKL